MGLTNIPVQLTSFIGREREIADVRRLLFSSRLVTLTGAGGSGKTRLAIQIADLVSESFTDGVWLVDLVPLREPGLVPQLIVQTFGLRPICRPTSAGDAAEFCAIKTTCFLFWIIANTSSKPAHSLPKNYLSQAPELRILATSSVALAISGETIYPGIRSGLACY